MHKYLKFFTLKKVFAVSFLFVLFFVTNISEASASTLYWYSNSSTNWNNSANWWSDESHTIQANVPTTSDDVFLYGTIAPIINLDSWTHPNTIDTHGLTNSSAVGGVIFTSSASSSVNIKIDGNATFNNSAENKGTVTGDAIFNGGSSNEGVVLGNSTFNSVAFNDGTVGKNATFNDNSYNVKVVNGNAFYTNSGYSQTRNQGLVRGNATLAFATAGTATLTNSNWGTVVGTTTGNDGQPVYNFIFNGGANEGIINGTSTFNGGANVGTTTNAVFNGRSVNDGVVINYATFNDSSYIYSAGYDNSHGEVIGTAIFNGTSQNNDGTVGTAIFNASSSNWGLVTGNATFNDESNGWTGSQVYGNSLFNGDDSYSCGVTSGTKTRRYTTDASTTIDFIGSSKGYPNDTNGPWTVLADGAHVYLYDAIFDSDPTSPTYTTLQTLNGGSIDTTTVDPNFENVDTKTFTCNSQIRKLINVNFPPNLVGPQILNSSATVNTTSATINWNTDTSSNSVVNASNQTFGLAKVDSSPTTTHSETISNVASCSTYQYRIASADSNNIAGISNTNSFTTTGCTGNAPIIEATSTPDVSVNTGANISFTANNGQSLSLAVPQNFTSTSSLATFELTRVDTNALLNAVTPPTGVYSANANTYQLGALTDASTLLPTFSNPLTLTMSYSPSDLAGIDPSTLNIQRYDADTGWTQLSNCSVNTSNSTVTCSTNHFSIFSLFGLHPLTSRGHSGGHSGSIIKLSDLASPTLPALSNTLPASDTNLSAAEVASLKTQLNSKIADLMKQLLKLLTQRLNSLLGL